MLTNKNLHQRFIINCLLFSKERWYINSITIMVSILFISLIMIRIKTDYMIIIGIIIILLFIISIIMIPICELIRKSYYNVFDIHYSLKPQYDNSTKYFKKLFSLTDLLILLEFNERYQTPILRFNDTYFFFKLYKEFIKLDKYEIEKLCFEYY